LPHQPDEDLLDQIIDVVGLADTFGEVANQRYAVAAVEVRQERVAVAGDSGIDVRALGRGQRGVML
jgi:hypothetical protein